MARPLSEAKRKAILEAAAEAVARDGLGASTASIARGAGVAEGTVFTYFPSKDALLDAVYLDLKSQMTAALTEGMPAGADTRDQCRHVWGRFIAWGVDRPSAHRAITQLGVSGRISQEARDQAMAGMAGLAHLIGDSTRSDLAGDQDFVGAMMTALMETTITAAQAQPNDRERLTQLGFEAAWRAIGGDVQG